MSYDMHINDEHYNHTWNCGKMWYSIDKKGFDEDGRVYNWEEINNA